MTTQSGPHFDVRVIPQVGGAGWLVKIDDLGPVGPTFSSKDEAERAGAGVAEAIAFVSHGTAELYVHNRDGTYEEGGSRRTYPRSADPAESKG